MLFARRRDSSWCKPLFNITSISHSVELFDHLLTFEWLLLLVATSCDHEQQACMHACKLQLSVWRSWKSCTKIAKFGLVLAFLQTASKNIQPICIKYEPSIQLLALIVYTGNLGFSWKGHCWIASFICSQICPIYWSVPRTPFGVPNRYLAIVVSSVQVCFFFLII